MNYLSVENLTKSYGAKVLFENISFGIEQGQKVALVARNGTGKSSLLRILSGKDIPDSGNVVLRNGISVGYLEQEPEFNLNHTVAQAVFDSTNPVLDTIRQYEEILLTEDYDGMQRLIEEMERLDAWDYESKVKTVLTQLKITDLTQQISSLSGGQRKRVALARLLVMQYDLIIMDEPTNHLDLDMIEWLEEYLERGTLSLLLVTHDRYFLERVCDEIIEIADKRLYHYEGNYSYFLEKKAEREANLASSTDKARNLFKRELEWIRKMPKARGTKSKSRVDAFSEIKEKASYKAADETVQLDVKMSRLGGKVVEMKKVKKAFGDLTILKNFEYTFKTGERIGIVGKNGVGKSTFLNILQGKEKPDSGIVDIGETVVFGYYSQKGLVVGDDKRVMDVIKDIADVVSLSDGSKVSATQMLQLFQFSNDLQYTFVHKLSGGERRRLYLLTVLMQNPNVLILDEPTNDLDLLTLQTLEEFLMNFKGCLLIVSHDRYFMDKLAEHLFVFEGEGEIRDFNGNYAEYRAKEKELLQTEKKSSAPKAEVKEEVKPAATETPLKTKLSYKEKFELEQLDKDIASLEKEKSELDTNLTKGSSDHAQVTKWSERYQEVVRLLDEKGLRWLELSDKES